MEGTLQYFFVNKFTKINDLTNLFLGNFYPNPNYRELHDGMGWDGMEWNGVEAGITEFRKWLFGVISPINILRYSF